MSILERSGFGSDPAGLSDEVDEPPWRREGRLGQFVGFMALSFIVAALFGLVAFHATIAEAQNVLDGLDAELVDARVENDRLRLAVARLESPNRVVATAKIQLGMVEPIEIIYLTPPAHTLTAAEIRDAFLGRSEPGHLSSGRGASRADSSAQ